MNARGNPTIASSCTKEAPESKNLSYKLIKNIEKELEIATAKINKTTFLTISINF